MSFLHRLLHSFTCFSFRYYSEDAYPGSTLKFVRDFRECTICGRRYERIVVGSVGVGIETFWEEV